MRILISYWFLLVLGAVIAGIGVTYLLAGNWQPATACFVLALLLVVTVIAVNVRRIQP